MNFVERILSNVSRHSELVYSSTGEKYSHQEIHSYIKKVSGFLTTAGLTPGDRIILGTKLTPLSALVYLGSIYGGIVPVPVEMNQLKGKVNTYMETSGARGMWTDTAEPLDDTVPNAVMINGSEILTGTESAALKRDDDDLAVLVATSGTTGKPRFVMVSHGNLISNTEAISRSQRLTENERAMQILPISYCFGASILHTHLYMGGGVVFDDRFMFPDKVLNAINEYGCTTFAGVPSVYHLLLRRSSIYKMSFPSMKRFLQAGGPLDVQSIQSFTELVPGIDFYVMYGQTEATARISCLEPELLEKKEGSVGKPLDNLEIKITDENDNEVTTGESGLIWIKGPSITSGYWNEPEATRETFIDGWLNTRDYGRLDEEGYIWIEGRNVDFLKIRGRRITFTEIEERVRSVEGIVDAAVYPVKHVEAGETPAVFIIPENGRDTGELAEIIKSALPSIWSCEYVIPIDAMPLTDRGKLRREGLGEILKEMNIGQ